MASYVKFRRGTPEAFKALGPEVEQDTLYFIFDEAKSTADLYLGSKLISSGENDLNSLPEINLGDLKNVSLEDPISSSDVLVYNEQTKHWENRALEDLLETYIPTFSIATDDASIESIDGKLQLKDFGTGYFAYVPAEKDKETGEIITPSTYEYTEGFKSGLELRVVKTDDGKLSLGWYEPGSETVEDIAANIENISKTVDTLDDSINAEGGIKDQVVALQTNLETTNTTLSELSGKVDTKADAENVYTKTEIDTTFETVYTKTETDTAIGEAIAAADHLKRKKVNSPEDINETAEDADQYIYMVPTGFQEEDDKYDEYMVIDGVVEKVGSWEVNLEGYATVNYVDDELAKKVDAKTGERLITDEEAAKLGTIEEGAQKNYITSIDENQLKIENGNLSIKSINMNAVTNLEETLNSKATNDQLVTVNTKVTNLETLLNNKITNHENRIAKLEGQLTWASLTDDENA